jgi:hypothetical protein
MMTLTTDLIGIALLALGTAVAVFVKGAQFRRTNKYGVERFPTFGAKLRVRLGGYMLIGCSAILLTVGTLILASNHIDSWGWIVMAPVVLLMLFLLVGLT